MQLMSPPIICKPLKVDEVRKRSSKNVGLSSFGPYMLTRFNVGEKSGDTIPSSWILDYFNSLELYCILWMRMNTPQE